MAFFKGQETYSIDNKGRVSIPAKMRKYISAIAENTFTITKGFGKCVAAYPKDEWEKIEQKYTRELDMNDPVSLYYIRMMLSNCEEATLDSQQRINLPGNLLKEANINIDSSGCKVLILGVMDHIEFWHPEEFSAYQNSFTETFEEIATKVLSKKVISD